MNLSKLFEKAQAEEYGVAIVEGWLLVNETEHSSMPHASAGRPQTLPGWHQGFCVLRPDQSSLICYKTEQHSLPSKNLPRIRLDGGTTTFLRHWKLPLDQTPKRPKLNDSNRKNYLGAGMFNTLGRMTSINNEEDRLTTDRLSAIRYFSTLRISRKRNMSENHLGNHCISEDQYFGVCEMSASVTYKNNNNDVILPIR